MGGGRVDRLDRDRRLGAAELADRGRDVGGRHWSVGAREQVSDEPVHLFGEGDAPLDPLETFLAIERQEVRRAELREGQRAKPLEPVDVVVDVIVERRVDALPARGADAVDLYHVATEEQTGFPFEQRAMPPRMPAGEDDPAEIGDVDPEHREHALEHSLVGRRDAAIDQRAAAARGVPQHVDPERRVGDLGIIGGDAERPGRDLERGVDLHRIHPINGIEGIPSGAMRRNAWLGLDFGTSSVKALLVSGDGSVAGRASAAYPTTYAPGGVAEQEADDYLRAAREAIAACGANDMPLDGIGLAGQTPTLVPVDAQSEPVRPALTWQDHRADDEARTLEDELGDPEPLFGTRLPWTAAYAPAKLLWLSRHEPETVARTRFVLQPKGYAGLRLTGSPLSDPWSSKGLCHVLTSEPAAGVLGRVGFAPEVAPPLAAAWERRGAVTSEAAAAFRLSEGAPVSVGWSDAAAAMLAVGAFDHPSPFVL